MIRGTWDVIDYGPIFGKFTVLVGVADDLNLLAVLIVGVGEVDVVVLLEVRMERDVHQPALARGLDVRHGEDGFGNHMAALENADAALPLGKEHVAIREP